MGLDTRVYIDAKRLLSVVDLAHTTRDSYTGEVNSDSGGQFIAIQKRLGNTSLISWLKEQVAVVLTDVPESIILTKVLYSATHSGDVIDAADFPQLQREIQLIRGKYKENPDVEIQQFLDDIEELIDVAREHGNPIVFV